ncbi:MAG: hypothetical protein LCH95_23895 [Proteobacteria bacterium]|nr:hypothetical protein [Pseudomonadota bacterium]
MAAAGPARILVVEDEFLVALELESILSAGGLEVLGPASTVGAALEIIAGHRPDAAVLDVDLRGESVTPVAVALRRLEVPFVLATAYRADDLPDALRGAVNMGKPVDSRSVVSTLKAMLGASP